MGLSLSLALPAMPQYWGLITAFVGLLVIALALLITLARLVRGTDGPWWWVAAAVLVLAGTLLSGTQMLGEAPWQRAAHLLGNLLILLGVSAVGEGLHRQVRGRTRGRWMLSLAGVQLIAGAGFELAGWPLAHLVLSSGLVAAVWVGIAFFAATNTRRGFHGLFLGLAFSALVQAGSWIARGVMLMRADTLADAAPAANSVLLAGAFVATGALVLLYVLLVNFRLAAQLREKALHDPLTGVLNRRGFEAATARLEVLAAELEQSIVVLMLDIDNFRQVNEQNGPQVGDLVLKALAQLAQRAKRETDVLARLGGEEFCLVLPGTDVLGARVFADRLRRSFEALEIDTGRSFLSCTVSVGVACASARMLQARRVDLLELLHRADQALYDAKRGGRNRVRFYASHEDLGSRLDSRLFASTAPVQTGERP